MKRVLLLGIVGFVLAGCVSGGGGGARITFNRGKPFLIPSNAKAWAGNRVSPAIFREIKKNVPSCRPGDVIWINSNVYRQSVDIGNKYGWKSQQYIGFVKQIFANRRASGCVKHLSKQEYQYYMVRSSQIQANRRAQLYYNAATAPKTYNVNHNIYYYGR